MAILNRFRWRRKNDSLYRTGFRSIRGSSTFSRKLRTRVSQIIGTCRTFDNLVRNSRRSFNPSLTPISKSTPTRRCTDNPRRRYIFPSSSTPSGCTIGRPRAVVILRRCGHKLRSRYTVED